MSSLYSRLYRYRERKDRNPLEDFMSEALCDILNRLPKVLIIDFVSKLFLDDHLAHVWKAHAKEWNLSWETQQVILDGRPDLVLYADAEPILVVENKVGALATSSQLEKYGRWLSGKCKGNKLWPGALTLLGHFVKAPRGFGQPRDKARYYILGGRVCEWAEVWKWLKQTSDQYDRSCEDRPSWLDLTQEFLNFMQEKNMSSEQITPYDLSNVQVYLRNGTPNRFYKTFDHFRSQLKPTIKKICQLPAHFDDGFRVEADGEYGLIYEYVNLKKTEDWYLGWGYRFPGLTDAKSWADPTSDPYAFMCVAPNNEGEAPYKRPLKRVWTEVDGAEPPLKVLLAYTTDVWPVKNLSDWLASRGRELEALIR